MPSQAESPDQGKSLADRFDDFTRNVFGGILPGKGSQPTSAQAAPPLSRTGNRLPPPHRRTMQTRVDNILSRSQSSGIDVDAMEAAYGDDGPTATPPLVARSPNPVTNEVKRIRRPDPTPAEPVVTNAATEPPNTTQNPHLAQPVPKPNTGLTNLANPINRPLHERLTSARESAFDHAAETTTTEPAATGPRTMGDPVADGQFGAQPMPNPTIASRQTNRNVPTGRSLIQPSPLSLGEPSSDGSSGSQTTTLHTGGSSGGSEESVLFARKSPILSVQTVGPRRISVGKQSRYELTIQNAGEVGADEVVVLVDLPAWADVLGAEATVGATQSGGAANNGGAFQWRIGHLKARGRERLVLTIVPRESRPFDLGVHWNYKPIESKTMIEVQEPKVVMNLEGPSEVFYGKKEIYRLNLSNTGNGDAENVGITLLPIGTGQNTPVSHNLGLIRAGEQKSIEVELTARQSGNLTIKVEVQGDGGVHAELTEQVLVRRAALAIDVQGPGVQYVGTEATYRVQVRNTGNAPAKDLKMAINLPAGAKYVSGVDNARLTANGTKLEWTLDSLHTGGEQTFMVRCNLGLPGTSRLDVLSTADGDLSTTANAVTQVEAMADLSLEVVDPPGPVPVGDEAVFEVHISNRGTKDAQNIEVVGFFSRGIEPVATDGCQGEIAPGRVTFNPVLSLPAGAQRVMKVRARAEQSGNHIFRAEVYCKTLGTRLVSEETTHFYQGGPASTPSAPSVVTGSGTSSPDIRTAERYQPSALPSEGNESALVDPSGSSYPPATMR